MRFELESIPDAKLTPLEKLSITFGLAFIIGLFGCAGYLMHEPQLLSPLDACLQRHSLDDCLYYVNR